MSASITETKVLLPGKSRAGCETAAQGIWRSLGWLLGMVRYEQALENVYPQKRIYIVHGYYRIWGRWAETVG